VKDGETTRRGCFCYVDELCADSEIAILNFLNSIMIITTLWYLKLFVPPKATLVSQGYENIVVLLDIFELLQNFLCVQRHRLWILYCIHQRYYILPSLGLKAIVCTLALLNFAYQKIKESILHRLVPFALFWFFYSCGLWRHPDFRVMAGQRCSGMREDDDDGARRGGGGGWCKEEWWRWCEEGWW